jgi:hypothetical protein
VLSPVWIQQQGQRIDIKCVWWCTTSRPKFIGNTVLPNNIAYNNIQVGPKVGVQYTVYYNVYCVPTFGPPCRKEFHFSVLHMRLWFFFFFIIHMQ